MTAISVVGARLVREARNLAGLSQRDLAVRARTAQSVVARIEGGQVSPSIETLSRLLAAAGFSFQAKISPQPATDPVVEVYKRDVDRTLLLENLKRSTEDRIRTLAAHSAFANEARRAGRAARSRRK